MNKIKVIDLLNMISKGEEVPKHVRYYNMIENIDDIMYVCKENIFCKLDTLQIHLNSRVEIIEEPQEHKIPEKIPLQYADNRKSEEVYEYLRCKINEILDYLEEIK